MKKKFLTNKLIILTALLSLLGMNVSCSKDQPCEYGPIETEYNEDSLTNNN